MKIGSTIMTGHCGNPATHDKSHNEIDPFTSHQRCIDNGGGVTTQSTGEFHPCPCSCHVGEEAECQCGELIYEGLTLGLDEDGDMQWVHLIEDGSRFTMDGCS